MRSRFRSLLVLASAATAVCLALAVKSVKIRASQSEAPVLSTSNLPLPPPDASTEAEVKDSLAKLPLYFVENQGQADPQLAFYLHGRETDVYFSSGGVTFALTRKTREAAAEPVPVAGERWVVKLDFLDPSPEMKLTGGAKTSAHVSYFRGDPADWKTGISTYSSVGYRGLWPGVDLEYTGEEGHLKYTFTIAPGVDPAQIRLAYRGATDVRLTEEGRLAVSTPMGGFEDDRPYAYQDIEGTRIEVEAAYVLEESEGGEARRYGFRLGPYDATKPLILDPVFLTYAGYIGGSSTDSGNNIAVDTSGNAYVVGWTQSSQATFPETVGPDLTLSTAPDAFVAKINAAGTALVYCGYIGGQGSDFGNRITVDGSGNAYVIGQTNSGMLFPATVGPDTTHNGGNDAFVAKVNATGTALVYAGFIGGSGNDTGSSIAVDGSGNAYVNGRAESNEATFPVTVGPFLTHSGGIGDTFVAKINAAGTALVYCGYIGGSGDEDGVDVAVDGSGNLYTAGWTTSTQATFPETVGPDVTHNGGEDAFVAKVNATGTALTYCGYIGGSGADRAFGIAVDGSDNAYVAGRTTSTQVTFPVAVGPDLTHNGGSNDAFVAKINAAGTGLDYCGYIGGSGNELLANDIGIDGAGNAYIFGFTSSTEATFPVTRGPDQTFNGGTWDAYVAKVKADGTGLSYAGFLGGATDDFGNGIAVDAAGNAYVVGQTSADETTFPANVGPDVTYNGGSDAFVAKIEDTGGTAVELTTLAATGFDATVRIQWETASELDNLGFHLYRSSSPEGPYERITPSLIPGLGSSPEGARYHYLDTGLRNGSAYFYKLEDMETTGKTEIHGPVSATPVAGAVASEASVASLSSMVYGDPPAGSMRVVERTPRAAVLELETSGFIAEPQADGSVRLSVPGFWNEGDSGSLSIPVFRSWIEVPADRAVRIASVREEEVQVFSSLRPSAVEGPEIVATPEGVVRLERKPSGRRSLVLRGSSRQEKARVISVGYQGEIKKALVEISPLRWDANRGELVLSRKLVVRLTFAGRVRAVGSLEDGHGRRHRESASHQKQTLFARLGVRDRSVYAVSFDEVMSPRSRPREATSLRLSRLGQVVPFHLEPDEDSFGPGSKLYFFSEGASLNAYGDEAVYELGPGEGERMPVLSGLTSGDPVRFHWQRVAREENRYYQAALIEARDPWLWDVLFAPVRKSYSFHVSGLDTGSARSARLEIGLQGASEVSPSSHHRLRTYVNGVSVAETSLAGKESGKWEAELPSGLLRDGTNELEIENLGDTEAPYSMVMLDRFEISYPRHLSVEGGFWEGSFTESGIVQLSGLEEGALVLDITGKPSRLNVESSSFRVEAGRTYAAVRHSSVGRPSITIPRTSALKAKPFRADYVIVAPESFLPLAEPLLELRRKQGLRSRAVSIEDVYSEFGFGESRPEAVEEFLAYAYHHSSGAPPRYVLLLGDASYDFKNYLGTGVKNQVPPLMVKTSFLWTASDAGYAAVNGDDLLPDMAIGRLPAASRNEARILMEKILSYETSAGWLEGPVVLVADNPDGAGDFVANAEELANGLLAARSPEKIYLDRLGAEATRAAIAGSLDQGASLLSYIGHGGIHLWAQENILDNTGVGLLSPQRQTPVLLTLNCLNGYFHFPYFNSLAEELVKAQGKGAIAAISPSGLSLNAPAHVYHQALLRELLSPRNPRLGDAFLSAQGAYAETGAFPELLSIYHLLGDPALRLR